MKIAFFGVAAFIAGVVFSTDVNSLVKTANNEVHAFVDKATGKTEALWDSQKKDQQARMQHLQQAVKKNPSENHH